MKMIVETTGDFQVYAAMPEQFARAERACVVTPSHLMSTSIGKGLLKVLGQVNDEATDDELVKYLASAGDDKDLAVQSFMSEFPVEEDLKPVKAEKPQHEPVHKPAATKAK